MYVFWKILRPETENPGRDKPGEFKNAGKSTPKCRKIGLPNFEKCWPEFPAFFPTLEGPFPDIFKVPGGLTFGPRALWFVVHRLSGAVLKTCIGIIFLDAVWKKVRRIIMCESVRNPRFQEFFQNVLKMSGGASRDGRRQDVRKMSQGSGRAPAK